MNDRTSALEIILPGGVSCGRCFCLCLACPCESLVPGVGRGPPRCLSFPLCNAVATYKVSGPSVTAVSTDPLPGPSRGTTSAAPRGAAGAGRTLSSRSSQRIRLSVPLFQPPPSLSDTCPCPEGLAGLGSVTPAEAEWGVSAGPLTRCFNVYVAVEMSGNLPLILPCILENGVHLNLLMSSVNVK